MQARREEEVIAAAGLATESGCVAGEELAVLGKVASGLMQEHR
jgi:hypothetical protein